MPPDRATPTIGPVPDVVPNVAGEPGSAEGFNGLLRNRPAKHGKRGPETEGDLFWSDEFLKDPE
jgi:hypothetical protein